MLSSLGRETHGGRSKKLKGDLIASILCPDAGQSDAGVLNNQEKEPRREVPAGTGRSPAQRGLVCKPLLSEGPWKESRSRGWICRAHRVDTSAPSSTAYPHLLNTCVSCLRNKQPKNRTPHSLSHTSFRPNSWVSSSENKGALISTSISLPGS